MSEPNSEPVSELDSIEADEPSGEAGGSDGDQAGWMPTQQAAEEEDAAGFFTDDAEAFAMRQSEDWDGFSDKMDAIEDRRYGIQAKIVAGLLAVLLFGGMILPSVLTSNNPVAQETGGGLATLPAGQTGFHRPDVVSIPQIASLRDMSLDDAVASLGDGWAVVSSEDPAVAKIAFMPASFAGDKYSPFVTVVLGNGGKVTSSSFACSMDTLGYQQAAFFDIISDTALIGAALGHAGLRIDEAALLVPARGQITSSAMVDAAGDPLDVWTYSDVYTPPQQSEPSDASLGTVQALWSLTVAYGYSSPDKNPANLSYRVMTIRFS